MQERQIVHVDMDAFYASVEQRDNPELRGKPVVVAWLGNRSVVCAASYEARKFGVRSAMPAVTAERLCPSATFIPPNFAKYRAVSGSVHDIFREHTDLIEPLSLDEAYLDVTLTKSGLPSGLEVAKSIRAQIRGDLGLTASAGVAPNKFLAKIASDWRKPDGLFEIRPEEVYDFLFPLPAGRLPGVGKVTESRLERYGLRTVGDIRGLALSVLEGNFGSHGRRLFDLVRGIDQSEVIPDRPTQSISAEDTFESDLLLGETTEIMIKLAKRVWESNEKETRAGRTVTLKLKTSDFRVVSRSHTPEMPPGSEQDLIEIALYLQSKVLFPPGTRFRLVGVGLSNFTDRTVAPAQLSLFR
jgi:DNA polymerase-4